MSNVPAGAMSTPYGSNSRTANELMDALDRQSGSTWGKYGDPPKKYTNLPKSEADALIEKENKEAQDKRLQEYVNQAIAKALETQKTELTKEFSEQLTKVKIELEVQKQVNEQLKTIFTK